MFYVSNISGTQSLYTKTARRRFPKMLSRIRPAAALRKEPDDELDVESDVELEVKSHPVNPYSKLDDQPPKRERALLASQIMSSPVITLFKEQTLAEAGRLFQEHRFRHVPVVSQGGELIGILSDRDYLAAADKEISVQQVMTANVLTARPNTEIRLIADMLFKERIGGMPIVDESGELVGMLTRSDILCALVNKAPLEIWV